MSHGWQAAWLHGLPHSPVIRGSSFSIPYIYLNISLSIYLDISHLSRYLIYNVLKCHTDGKPPGCMVSRILLSSVARLSQSRLAARNLWPILTTGSGKSSSSSRPASQSSETCGRRVRKCSLPEENAKGQGDPLHPHSDREKRQTGKGGLPEENAEG